MKQPQMALTNCDSSTDVRKKGVLLKVKTAKKKLFVLRDESSSGPARLEYYDSAKKFGTGGPPRRSIILRNCFSINAKSDNPRHPFAIVLYTNDDCFVIGCESDVERQDWLKALLELRRPGHRSATTRAGSACRHVWPVTVQSPNVTEVAEGPVGNSAVVPSGEYRLCMSPTNVSLQSTDGRKDILIPMECIRCCGFGDRSVYFEIDRRSASSLNLNMKELWMNAEDAIIAQSIHDTLVNLLNSCATLQEPFRTRAHTSVDLTQKRNTALMRRGAAVDCTRSLPGAVRSSVDGSRYVVMFQSQSSGPREVLTADNEYMVMSTPTDEGYLDMSAPRRRGDGAYDVTPMSTKDECAGGQAASPTVRDLGRRLDVVQSFVVPDEDDNSSDDYDDVRGAPDGAELPKRAYSVGSKPMLSSKMVVRKLNGVDMQQQQQHSAFKCEPSVDMEANHILCTKESSGDDWSRDNESRLCARLDAVNAVVDPTNLNKSTMHDLESRRVIVSPSAQDYMCMAGKATNVQHSEIRPRTSTFPWDLLRSRGCTELQLEPQRPRSASNGNTIQLRDRIEAVKRRLMVTNGFTSISRGFSDRFTSEPMITASRRGVESDLCEYVEMGHGSELDYVDMTIGKGLSVPSSHHKR